MNNWTPKLLLVGFAAFNLWLFFPPPIIREIIGLTTYGIYAAFVLIVVTVGLIIEHS